MGICQASHISLQQTSSYSDCDVPEMKTLHARSRIQLWGFTYKYGQTQTPRQTAACCPRTAAPAHLRRMQTLTMRFVSMAGRRSHTASHVGSDNPAAFLWTTGRNQSTWGKLAPCGRANCTRAKKGDGIQHLPPNLEA